MSNDPQTTKHYVVTAITDVFVRDPNLRARYIKTDRSVIEVACPACGAKINEPCFSGIVRRRYTSYTHSARRFSARCMVANSRRS